MVVLKGWRTVLFNMLAAGIGTAATLDMFRIFDDPKVAAGLIIAIAMANVALRAITDTPIGIGSPTRGEALEEDE